MADDESRAEVGRSLLAVGEQQEEIGKTAEAEASYEEARRNLIAVAASQPGVTVYRADLATADSRLGWLFSKTGQLDEGLRLLERCRDARAKLVEANPNVDEFQTGLASIHNDIGFVLVQTGRPAAALESYSKAMAIQQRLADANPGVTRFQNDLARTHTNTGHLMRNTGKTVGVARVARQGGSDPAEAGRREPQRLIVPERAGHQPQQYRKLTSRYREDGGSRSSRTARRS